MKVLLKTVATGITAFSLMGGVAAAQVPNGCNISNTGADSTNVCEMTTENELSVTCRNEVDFVFVNNQNSGSGSVTLTGNTNSGFAYSGDASNQNNIDVVTDVSCAPAEQVAVTTPTGGQGAVPQVKAAEQSAPKAASLPVTGANPLAMTAIAAATAGAIAGLAHFGAKAYRFLALK
ncbi:hypothetical protein COU91_00785 [Candidatus Saccharibacteria bacterium CG10_big_fil_rev_8_21_14_0_10_47_8]|nr:MAG: hypothetical protein COU91_00785 [Candidatus Saccharibacteria bacterium CG10_big_fil_rev_8_21_14_0_10_47_8]